MQNKIIGLFLKNAKQHLTLALPILGTQLAQVGMNVADVMISGRFSPLALAGVGLGASVYMPLMLFLLGIMLAASPNIAEAIGARKFDRIPQIVQQSLYLGLITLMFLVVAILLTPYIFKLMNSEQQVADTAYIYLLALIPGLPALLVWQVLRIVFEAMGRARLTLNIALTGLVVNVFANIVLVNGYFGLPALGALGCGIATSITIWLMAILAYLMVTRFTRLKDIQIFKNISKPSLKFIKELAKLGLPIAGAIFIEVSLFSTIALFISDLGVTTMAAHQITMNIGSVIFALPLSLGMASTILIGKILGAGKFGMARLSSIHALFLSVAVAVFIVVVIFTFKYPIINLYVKTDAKSATQIIALSASLINIALLFQIFDTLQVTATGCLRGFKDTKVVFFITIISYWLVGFMIGHSLGEGWFGLPNLGVHGYWLGLLFGLGTAAIALVYRLLKLSKARLKNYQPAQ